MALIGRTVDVVGSGSDHTLQVALSTEKEECTGLLQGLFKILSILALP